MFENEHIHESSKNKYRKYSMLKHLKAKFAFSCIYIFFIKLHLILKLKEDFISL